MRTVEIDSTMSMVVDQAAAAAVTALISASGVEASASAPAPATLTDISSEVDIALRLPYGDNAAFLVISEPLADRLVGELGGSSDDADGAWSLLTDLANAAGNAARERMISLVEGLAEMGMPEPLSDWSEADLDVGQSARIEVSVDGLDGAWVIWITSDDLLTELVARSSQPAVIDSVEYPELGEGVSDSSIADVSFLADVSMGVTVELGRTVMSVREVLKLTQGSVVELDRAAGAPVDVLISGSVVARGEVVVIEDQLGVRILEIIDSSGAKSR